MPYPTTYSWPIIPPVPPTASEPINPGPPVVAHPSQAQQPQFGPGIKFANVPGGNALNVEGVGDVYTTSGVTECPERPSDQRLDGLSGVIRFRFRKQSTRVPLGVSHINYMSSDRFSQPVFSFTGQYTGSQGLPTFDNGFWNLYGPPSSASIRFARSRYMGGILPNGGLLCAGGLDSTATPMSGAEYFLSASFNWTPLPDMPTPKSHGAGIVLSVVAGQSVGLSNAGDIFVTGGSGSSAAENTGSYEYNSLFNVWNNPSFAMIVPRIAHQIVQIPDGRVFLPGGTGFVSGSTLLPFTGSEFYYPNTGTLGFFTGTAPIPLYPYNRQYYQLTLLNDGTVLLTGGKDPINSQPYPHALRFIPNNVGVPGSTGSWQVLPSMSFARAGHKAILLSDGNVLVCGGDSGPQSNMDVFLSMPLGAAWGSTQAISEVEIFNVTTQQWSHVGQMRHPRSHFMALPLQPDGADGRILVVGGQNLGTALSSSEIYDYGSNTWHEINPMQTGSYDARMFFINNVSPFTVIVPSGQVSGKFPALTDLAGIQIGQTNG
ncbi:MAG: Kelch repeat-containing protein [Acidiferrobacterales bacterium]